MPNYRVEISVKLSRQIIIEAESRDEADEIARMMMCDMEVEEFDGGFGDERDACVFGVDELNTPPHRVIRREDL